MTHCGLVPGCSPAVQLLVLKCVSDHIPLRMLPDCPISAAKLPLEGLGWHSTIKAAQKYVYSTNNNHYISWTHALPYSWSTYQIYKFQVISFPQSKVWTTDLVQFQLLEFYQFIKLLWQYHIVYCVTCSSPASKNLVWDMSYSTT
jgi:hypothetical protein